MGIDNRVAFSTALLTFGVVAGVIYRYGPEPLTFIYDHWLGLVTASILMAVVQGLGCYLASFRKGALLALGGNSGNPIYDVRALILLDPYTWVTESAAAVLHRP